jgi:hypothetical protein
LLLLDLDDIATFAPELAATVFARGLGLLSELFELRFELKNFLQAVLLLLTQSASFLSLFGQLFF